MEECACGRERETECKRVLSAESDSVADESGREMQLTMGLGEDRLREWLLFAEGEGVCTR